MIKPEAFLCILENFLLSGTVNIGSMDVKEQLTQSIWT